MLRILFCGLKYEYGKPHLGLSAIEYGTFYKTLKRIPGVECDFFGMDEKIMEKGKDAVDAELIRTVEETKPDLLFCFLFTDEIKKRTIAYITNNTKTKTFNWFADDHWRFPIYSRFWAPVFTLVSTTDSKAMAKYHALGIKNVIKTQWAANVEVYKPQDQSRDIGKYQITFVGADYGNRSKHLEELKRLGLPAEGYGNKWPAGRVSLERMLEIFSFSKINLNFTESYFNWPKQMFKLFVKKESSKYKLNFKHPISNLQSFFGARRRQIKGRNFEVPATGGFLMTGEADNLDEYYISGKEIVIFNGQEDLAKKCKYYLENEDERKKIAEAGYQRTLKEHTYEKRFREIFKAMQLM